MILTREEFEGLVADALDTIPPELTRMMRNVVILVDDDSPPGMPTLFGLYEGTPLTERSEFAVGAALPDRITIFQRPLTQAFGTPEELQHQVRVTVVHEIAHHFGISDERLHELGWG